VLLAQERMPFASGRSPAALLMTGERPASAQERGRTPRVTALPDARHGLAARRNSLNLHTCVQSNEMMANEPCARRQLPERIAMHHSMSAARYDSPALNQMSSSMPTRAGRLVRSVALAAAMMAASGAAWPQAHSVSEGPYILRGSTVSSETLPESTANAHGIERDPRHGVLNVLLLRKDASGEKTVRGEVHAVARNLSGHKRDVSLREVDANGYVSHMGTYEFVRGEVIDFLIDARPQGADRTLSLTFRDRMWLVK
jgi:hypothetical protein